MKVKGQMALAALLALVGASTAHAKSLTTSASGVTFGIECTAVNVSKTKTITLNFIVRGRLGGELGRIDDHVLPPLTGHLLGSNGSDRFCEFEIVSGPAKDLRASMIVFDPGFGEVVAIEPAR
jgi:hypothetical protein